MSFVSAADNITSDVEGDTILSVTDDVVVEENSEDVSVEESSGLVLGVSNDVQSDENESEDSLVDSDAQVLGISNDELLRAGSPHIDDYTFANNGGTPKDVVNRIKYLSDNYKDNGGAILYLYGRDYNAKSWQNSGSGELAGLQKTQTYDIKNVKVIGGSPQNPNQIAHFTNLESYQCAFVFSAYKENLPYEFRENPKTRQGFYGTSGYNLINITLENLESSSKLLTMNGGSMTDCVINNCKSPYQFFTACGSYFTGDQINIINCNFTNCKQTYPGANGVKDGSGQFGAVFGVNMVGCNFINTSSAQHGGALCIADESDWGSLNITSTLTNCNFINVTSRWFAIYMHGNFSTSVVYLKSPQVIDGCNFINCTGSGEYSAGIGISHNSVIIRNSKFINNIGGQGSAIMVGGINSRHDGFSGRNYQGNDVLIEGCEFSNNKVAITGQTGSISPDHGNFESYPSGNAGAVYVYGNNTIIRDCIFNKNKAEEGDGAAIYIYGQRTRVENSKFYNHECNNGTIFIEGNNTKIIDSEFKENHAEDGSAIYILGSYTDISSSTFKNNNGTNGTVYIKGNYTNITSQSKFNDNNASYGGGIYILGKNTLISASDFENNNATQDGGGIYIKGDNTQIKDGSSFTENYAVNGGGIYLGGTNTEISATNFVGNNATHDGGGIYVRGNNTKAIAGSNFTENYAAHDGAGMYVEGMNTLISDSNFKKNNATNGAGMYIKGNNTNITSGSNFIENYAVNGAGAFLEGSNTFVSGSVFDKNNATDGAGMYVKGSNTKVTSNSNFTENYAAHDGAGMYVEGKNTLISASGFEGNNATSGAGMYIKGNNTNITSNSNFTGNNATYGGGVYIEGMNTLVSDSNFTENNATIGGGMYVKGSSTKISGSDFSGNNATTGGGMYISGNNTKIVSGSDFTENYADDGAGMYIEGMNTEISGSTFEKNNATHDGAGMYIKGNNTKVTSNSNFTENYAAHDGAGMYIEGSNTEVIGSTFEKNNATVEGGGMYIKGNDTKITQGSDFFENYASTGGGMYIEGMNTLVQGSKFEKNNATQDGGGMYISGNNTHVTSNSNFTENYAENGGGMYIEGSNTEVSGSKFESNNATNGAGMYITGNNTKVLSGSDFTANNATVGGGMYIDGMNTLVSGSKFKNNNATDKGAGMYISGNNTNVTDNSDFIENYAYDGAGMYIDGMNTLVSGSKFEKNNATHNGGGMYISGNNTNITSKSNFTENYAYNGGGVYIDGGNTSISGSNFKDNRAVNGAGGYIDGSDTLIFDSTFTVNEADNGAGIYVEGTDTEISKSTFTENNAVNGSGAYVDGKNTKILDSTFTVNNATNGAGVYVEGTDTEISKSIFTDNSAVNGAGGYVDGSNTLISDSVFEVNTATNGSGIYVKGRGSKINKSNFTDNSAVNGAGGYVDGSDTVISDSTFTVNEADNGAGIYVKGTDTEINNSNFTNNYAVNGAGGYVDGMNTEINNSTFTVNNATNGAGIYVKGTHTEINNSTFDHNNATDGAGGYVNGDNTIILDSTFEINNATRGAGIYVDGINTKILNTTFDHNTAVDGAGGYVDGSDTNITSDSIFENNLAVNGAGIYVNGARTNIMNTTFDSNNATNGGGAYIRGSHTDILNSTFIKNNVTYHGGAVYIDGSESEFKNNNFTYNEAVPDNKVSELSGLGGAIFVRGDNTYTFANDFEHNKARNGSAIYSSGTNFKLENDIFRENQAWSYLLVTVAEPVASYYNTKDVKIEVVHIGGDNMINAIHNNASFDQISLKNVSYIRSSPDNISGKAYTTNATEFEQPVDGVENSQNGTKLYQDDREYLQNITINVTYENTTVSYTFYSSMPNNGRGLLSATPQNRGAGNNNQVAYWEGLTNLYGDVYVTLPKASLKVGQYKVTATHPEDWNYKYILNSTRFAILPYVDLSVDKTSDKFEYFDDDIAVWTITVHNANNASNATNVVLDDLLPSDFEFISANATQGSYDNHTGKWTIGNMTNGSTVTLTIYALVESDVERMNHFAHIESNEGKVILDVHRVTEKDSYKMNDNATWNFTVTNNGPVAAHNVNITHLFPFEFEFREIIGSYDGVYNSGVATGEWYIDSIASGQTVSLKLKTIATADDDEVSYLVNVDYTEKHLNLTVSKASDKEEYHAGHIANFTITITNNKGCNATNVTLNDVLQPEFEFNGTYIANMGKYNSTTNKWTIEELKEGESAVLNIYSHTRIVRGNVTNYAQVSCDQGEWNYANNYANSTVEVVPLPQPVKSVSNITPNYHDFIEYNLTIYNTGNTTYKKNLTITDTLPIGLDFIEFVKITGADLVNQTNSSGASVDHIVDDRKVTWIITNIENKTSAVITVKLQVNGLGKLITNTSVINSIYNLANDTELYNKLIELTNNATFMKELYKLTDNSTFIKSIVNLTNCGSTFSKLIELVNNKTYVEKIGTLTNDTFKNALIGLTVNSVGINSTGNLTNNLTVTGPNGTNVTDRCTVYPNTFVDISVNITSDKDEYFVDDIAIWTITVSNAANGTNATNVTLKDLFPSNQFKFLNCTLANGSSFTGDVWYIGDLANGTNVTFTVYSLAIAPGVANHNVSVTCNETEWNYTNNKANKTVNVVVLPYPVKTVNNDTPYYNDIIEYNITIVNEGKFNYTNILNVTDSLPDGLIFNGTYKVKNANVTAFVSGTQIISWNLTNITAADAVITIWVKVVGLGDNIIRNGTFIANNVTGDSAVKYVGNLTNNVTVTGPNGTKKHDNCTVYAIPIVDLSVNITSDKNEYFVDDIAVWTITVSNAANGTNATNVTLKDLFPSGQFKFLNCTLANGSSFTGDVWYIGDLANGTNVTFTVYSLAIAPGVANHNVSVSCNETEWNRTNNDANKTVNVVVLPYPVKTVNNDTPYYNDIIEYNITIVNDGRFIYGDILNVTDSLPDGLIFNGTYKVKNANVTAFVSGTQIISWNLTNITAADAVITIWVKVVGLGDNIIRDADFIANNVTGDSAVKYVGNLTNNVTVTGPNGTKMYDNCSVYAIPIVDLSVNITSDKDEYFVDDIAVWTITVSNANNGTNATNVTLKDLFPSGQFKFINCTLANGTGFTGDVWYIGDLANGTNVTFTVYSLAVAPGIANHNVTVSCNETEWNWTNNKANKTVTVVVLPYPVKTVNNDTPYYNDIIEYNITIVNEGRYIYGDILNVTDSLPVGLLFNGTYKVNGANNISFVDDGQKLTWILTNITQNNAVITLWVKVVGLGDNVIRDADFIANNVTGDSAVKYVGNLTNNVTVTGPNGTKKYDNCSVYAIPIVDLSVNITSDKDEYFVDDIAVWTITVSNAANGTNATNVTLKDLFPSGQFRFINCTLANGTGFTGDVWYIGDLANGTNVTFTVYTIAVAPGIANHNVTVSCNETEWNWTNNKANKTVTVVVLPYPVKTVNNDTPYYNDIIEYNITIVNKGRFTYGDILNVTDSLPDGLIFNGTYKIKNANVTAFVNGTQIISWNLTSISTNNAVITLWVKVVGLGDEIIRNSTFIANNVTNNPAVKYVGNLTNNVTVTGPNGTKKYDNCTVYPIPIVDLSVNITSDKPEYYVDDIAVWTITVSNAANGTNATNVTLKDLFPSGQFKFLNCTLANGTEFTGDVWYIGGLANGTNVTFTVYSLAIAPGVANHNVTVSCNETEWNWTNNDANKTVNVVVLPYPVKTVNNDTPYYNDIIEYNITIVNEGRFNYTNILNITDSLPNGLLFNGTYKVNGADNISFVDDGQKLTWILTNITQNNAIITLWVKVVGLGDNIIRDADFIAKNVTGDSAVKYVGNLTNNVTVTGPNGTKQHDNCTVYAIPIVDISVNITSDRDVYFVDDAAVWTIVVSNAANGTNATNVNLKEIFPSNNFKFIMCIDSNGKPYLTLDDWIIPVMGNGTNLTFTVYSQAIAPGVNINNTAKVSCDEKEWNYTNNNATKSVNVVILPYPIKTVNNVTPYYNSIIEYNITVVNTGGVNYTSILNVTDSLPDGLIFSGDYRIKNAIVVGFENSASKPSWRLTNITKDNAVITLLVKVVGLGDLVYNSTFIEGLTKDSAVKYVGNLTNNVTVTGLEGANNSTNCTIYPVPIVDVSVNITSDKDEYFVDDIAVWTIVVSNAENGTNATNVTLKDLFPSGQFKFLNCTLANGTEFAGEVWYIGDLANGTNVTFTVYSLAIAPGTANHNVTVTCNETEWNKTNNDANKTVNVVVLPQPVKTVNNDTPYYHDTIEYNLTVVNTGKHDYIDVLTVVDSLPNGLEFMDVVKVEGTDIVYQIASNGSSVAYIVDGQKITWKLTNITTGNATITVRVKVNALGNLTNNLTVTGPNGTEATVNETVYPVPIVDLSVNITSDKDEYFVDDIAVWTITVSNAPNGTNATNVTLKDLFPSGQFKFLNCTLANGTEFAGDVWYIGDLANGTNVTFTVYSLAIAPGTANHNVTVSCNETEWNKTNNDANKTVNVVVLPQPVKTVNNDTPYYHDTIEYNLTVVNVGSSNYTDILTVVDSLPVGLQFLETVNVTGAVVISEVPNGQVITWKLTNITKGKATITIRVQVNALGNLTNNLTITGPKGSETTVNETVYPVPIVDVSVNITSDKDEYFVDDIAVWTIVVSNAANGTNATNVSLKDLFPTDYFKFINCTDSNGKSYNLTDGDWIIPFMGNGTNVTFTVYSQAVTPGDDINNTAKVNCTEKEWNYTNNNKTKSVGIVPLPRPVKEVSNHTPYYHEDIEYTLTVVNVGSCNYTDILTVVDSLPVGLQFLETLNVTGAEVVSEVPNGQVITWKLTNITRGKATITVRVKVNAIGNLTNNLTIVGPKGNETMVNCTVDPMPIVDIFVNITSDKEEYFVDDVAVWTIVVSNAANGTNASNIELSELLPGEFDYMYCDAPNGTVFNETSLVWSIPALANGTNITLLIYAHAKNPADDITNAVNASCTEKEWNYTNNKDDVVVDIIPFHKPAKVVSNTTPYYHEYVNYTLTVENMGNFMYTSEFDVIDSLPIGLEFVKTLNITGADKIREVHDGQVVKWALTNISAKSNATIVILVKVNAVGNLTNNLTVIGPRNATDMVNSTINPMPIVDISVNITSDKEEYFVDDVAVWTIVVSNAANGTNASNIELSELLPGEFDYMYCDAPNGTVFNESSLVWSIPALANGTNITLLIYAHAKNPADDITNAVNASCTDKEWNYTNNKDDVVVDIIPFHKPAKIVSNSTPYYHEYVNYTLTVENMGNFMYTSEFDVIDSLPVGLEFIRTLNITGADKIREVHDGQVVKWALTNISAKSNATIVILVKVNAVGNLTNNLTVIGPRNATDMVNCTINPMPIVDISVNITSDKEEYFVDDVAVWTIVVSNAANGTNASNIELSELLPGEFDYMYCDAPNGTVFNETSLVWSIPSLANGTNITLLIYSHAKDPADDITNAVNASCTEKEWNYTNNDDDVVVDIIPFHKPAKIVSNSTPYYHEYVNYTLTVENLGNFMYASEFDVIDSLPVGLEFIRTLNITGADKIREVHDGQVVKWALTNISAKSNATIVILVKVNAVGNLTNNLTVIGPRNATDMVNCTINPMPIVDLSVNITSDKKEYFVDDIAVWTITISNAGNGTNATNVTLKDLLPDEFKFINCTLPNGTSYNETTGVWTIGDMANGTNLTLTITSIAVTPAKDIVNSVNANCSEDEWNHDNNEANKTVSIVKLPYPVKTVNNSTPDYHGTVEYNLTIVNTGSNAYANNLTVIDTLPKGLQFLETVGIDGAKFVGKEVVDGQVITWVITNITDSATITVKVKVNAVGNLTNNLTVIGPNGTTSKVNCTIDPVPIVDLSVNITSDKKEYFVDDIAVWTITVSNDPNGVNATNVSLTNFIPSEFDFVNSTTGNGTFNPITGVWNIGDLENGTSVTLTVYLRANSTGNGIDNVVEVNCTEKDWNLKNNVDDELVNIVPLPLIEKTVNTTKPYNKEFVEYYLTVKNVGSTDYVNNLTVVDSLPVGLIFNRTVNIDGADLIKETEDGQKVTWIITNISANSNAVITIKVFVDDIGNLTNNLTVIGPNGENNTVNCTIDPVPITDLEIVKLVSSEVLHKNDIVAWTIIVTNNGVNTAVNTVVTDKLPSGLIYVSDDSLNNYNPKSGIWTIGDLASGKSINMTIKAKVNKTNVTITNFANVTTDTFDVDKTNNYCNNSTTVPPEADLEAIITNNFEQTNSTCHNGDTIVWTITVVNHGPDDAVNTTLKDVLPPGCIYVSDDSQGAYDNVTAVWSIGDLPVGKNVTLTITTLANTTNDTVYRNISVSSETYDPNMANNKDDSSVEIPPEADVLVIKVVSDKAPHKGDEIVWSITVYNYGPDTALNTKVIDKLPKGLVYVSDDSLNQYNPKTGVWDVGDLASGDYLTINIMTLVATTNRDIVNIAEGHSDTYDPYETNNIDRDTAQVPPEADLVITIEPDVTKVDVGDKVIYTITVVNLGPDTAENSFAVIEIPETLKLLGFKPSKGEYDPETGIWTIGDVAPGEKLTLLLTTQALKEGKVIVKAHVECDTYETDLSNNDDSAEIIVEQPPVPHGHVSLLEKYPTGNPIVMVILSLLAMAGISLRRKN